MNLKRLRLFRALASRGMAAAALLLLLFPVSARTDEPASRCLPPAASDNNARDARQLAAYIDQTLADAWSRSKVTPAAPADDAEFLRRIYLDLVGKIPSVAELQSFLADAAEDKRATVVDELLRRIHEGKPIEDEENA